MSLLSRKIIILKDELTVRDDTMYRFQFGKKIVMRDEASASGTIRSVADKIMFIVAADDKNS